MSIPIVPAIIPVNAEDIQNFLVKLPGVHEIHVDVVDGVFVSMVSWPYEPAGEPVKLFELLQAYTLEVDLMVAEPLKAAQVWLKAGADRLIFHAETIAPITLQAFAESANVSIGIAASLDTPDTVLWEYVPYVDYIQVMGIAAIGQQGQQFDERAITRIKALRRDFPRLEISIDGSMNETTIPLVCTTGVNRVIVGSAIYRDHLPQFAFERLTALTATHVVSTVV